MKILVTGGAGYIGSHTCVELLNNGYEVVIVDNYFNSKPEVLVRISELTNNKPFKFYECDIRDKDGLSKVFSENNIDAVINFAGLKAVGESCKIPLAYYDANVSGAVTLLEVMEQFNCKCFVFSSSATVYGAEGPLDESLPTGNTSSPYGRTKYMIEEILKDLYESDNSWSICILRYFNPIGAHPSGRIGEDPNGLPNNLMPFITRVAVGKLPKLTVFGDDYPTADGTCERDYIHVVDLAKGHICAVDKAFDSKKLSIYNLGNGCGYSVMQIVNAFKKVTKIDLPYVIGPRRTGDLASFYSVPTKANTELGWKAEYGIEEMCEHSWKWQSQNPNGFDK